MIHFPCIVHLLVSMFHTTSVSNYNDKKLKYFEKTTIRLTITMSTKIYIYIFFLLALKLPMGVVFYSPLVGFSLLAYEVS